MTTSRKTLTGKQRYDLWTWINNHAEECRKQTDPECAKAAASELGFAVTHAMIGYARHELGIAKTETPELDAMQAKIDELAARIAELEKQIQADILLRGIE